MSFLRKGFEQLKEKASQLITSIVGGYTGHISEKTPMEGIIAGEIDWHEAKVRDLQIKAKDKGRTVGRVEEVNQKIEAEQTLIEGLKNYQSGNINYRGENLDKNSQVKESMNYLVMVVKAAQGDHLGGTTEGRVNYLADVVDEREKARKDVLNLVSKGDTADGKIKVLVDYYAGEIKAHAGDRKYVDKVNSWTAKKDLFETLQANLQKIEVKDINTVKGSEEAGKQINASIESLTKVQKGKSPFTGKAEGLLKTLKGIVEADKASHPLSAAQQKSLKVKVDESATEEKERPSPKH